MDGAGAAEIRRAPARWMYLGCQSPGTFSPGLSLHLCIKTLAENSDADLKERYFVVRQHPVKYLSSHALSLLSFFRFKDLSISSHCSAVTLDDGSLDYLK